jgi:abortive infection bacteriophage resistance protein
LGSAIKAKYNKSPLSLSEQKDLMLKRGLHIPDETMAIRKLQEIGYYRLSAYFLPYQNNKDSFNSGTTFFTILQTYSFDRKLRMLAFDGIERIEVFMRSAITNHMSLKYNDSHWQDNRQLFKSPKSQHAKNNGTPFDNFQAIISKAKLQKHPEVFLKHYLDNYNQPTNPPSWMCLELLTMGELSHLYKGLLNADQQAIADHFGIHRTILLSWLHTISYIRNICAHHSRLWNRGICHSAQSSRIYI